MGHAESKFQPANIAVLTVSDTRTEENDTSGRYLVEHAQEAGHNVVDKQIVIDDMYKIRAIVSQWIADENIQAIMITGGTGFTSRDSTPEALKPLFDKEVEALVSCSVWCRMKRSVRLLFSLVRLQVLLTTP